MTIRIVERNGLLAFHSPYNAALVATLKTEIPAASRKWEPSIKAWMVAPEFGPVLEDLAWRFFGVTVTAPAIASTVREVTTILEVRYLGRVKDRGDGTESAFGWIDGGWNAIFPKAALLDFFGMANRPGETATLYSILGVRRDVSGSELKRAYRRMAKQWHPDVCREPDAAEQFQRIQHAWAILKDDGQRARYDAGLALEAMYTAQQRLEESTPVTKGDWAPPMRCGYILVRARLQLGRYAVEEILQWEDVINSAGQTLVTSWPTGADHFQEEWV